MKINNCLEEEIFNIFDINKKPVISLIGSIYIEHCLEIIKQKKVINTLVGGITSRISSELKFSGICSNVFSYLDNDIYLNYILQYFDNKNIPFTWGYIEGATKKIIRNLIDNSIQYETYQNIENKTNPIFIEEFLWNIKNIFFSVESWNSHFINILYNVKKRIFLDINTDIVFLDSKKKADHVFIRGSEIKKINKALDKIESNNIIVFYKKEIHLKNQQFDFEYIKSNYLLEAISKFESSYIKNIINNSSIDVSTNYAIDEYKKILISTSKF